MIEVYMNWPKSFVAGLDFLRAKDDTILDHPVYKRRSAELFKTLSSEVIALASAEPSFNFSGLTCDSLEGYYDSGLSGGPEPDFIIATARQVCNSLRVSEHFYDAEAQKFCLLVVQGDDKRAIKYLHRLVRPAVMLYRIRNSAHFTGMQGGKPTHRLYDETMKLCDDYMHHHPGATHAEIARNVRRKLLVNYKRVPAEDTIRRWLRNF